MARRRYSNSAGSEGHVTLVLFPSPPSSPPMLSRKAKPPARKPAQPRNKPAQRPRRSARNHPTNETPSVDQAAEPVDGSPQPPQPLLPEAAFGPPPGVGGTSFVPDITPSANESAAKSNGVSAINNGLEIRSIQFPYAQNPIPENPRGLNPTIQGGEKRKSPDISGIEEVPASAPKHQKALPQTDADLLAKFDHINKKTSNSGILPSPMEPSVAPLPQIDTGVARNSPIESSMTPMTANSTLSSEAVSIAVTPIDPTLQAHVTPSHIDVVPNQTSTQPATITQTSEDCAGDTSVTVGDSSVTAGDSSAIEREPTFNGKRKLTSASPRTKGLLNQASLHYKVRLISEHPFPENKGRKTRFARDAWKKAHMTQPPEDGAIKFTQDVEDILHDLGTTFRGSRGTELITLALAAYNLERPLSLKSQNTVKDLLIGGTFTYEAVFFDSVGNVVRHSADPNILLRKKPFHHPFLKTIIDAILFKGRPAPAKHDPVRFNPIPLETIAYACTLVRDHSFFQGYFTLKNLLSDNRIVFSGEDYAPVFEGFVSALNTYQINEPGSFEALRFKLSERPRKAKYNETNEITGAAIMQGMTRSLSDANIEAELEKRQQMTSNITVQRSSNIAIATATQSTSTVNATVNVPPSGAPIQHGYLHPHYPAPYQVSFGFQGGPPPPMVYPPPPGLGSGPSGTGPTPSHQ
ncbi:hypothetical protein M422DRAFT_43138 [Sphaerobolus stellatus SS14]|nr:hypothetical protein M422DRAFT_43138 [Sphaerobolus stellatus SS14]